MTFRPALRPGALLLRRDATHLQVGTSPGIVLDDRPGLLALLHLLDGVRDVDRLQDLARARIPELRAPVAGLLTELRAVGAVVDRPGHDAERRRRSARSVGFEQAPGTTSLVTTVRAILAAAGITRFTSTDPDLLVIASCGEAERTVFERAVLVDRVHLPVVIDEDRVRVGPFVQPGRTPCVGCHDLHRTDWDPAWPALLHQLGRGPTSSQPVALPALTAHAAAVEVAAEVLAHVDGGAPRSVGRCVVVGPSHDQRAMWPIAFHPRCACDLLSAA
jgi:hypothetical protein